MAVVFNHHDFAPGKVKAPDFCKAAPDPFELGQASSHCRNIHPQFPGDSDGAQRITYIVLTRQIEADGQGLRFVGQVHHEVHHPAFLPDVAAAYICGFGDTISHHSASHGRDHLRNIFIIKTQHGRAIEWKMVQKLEKGLFQIVETVVITFKVIAIDVGHQGHDRLQQQERPVTFIRLGHQVFSGSQPGVAAPGIEQAADDKSGVHARLGQ